MKKPKDSLLGRESIRIFSKAAGVTPLIQRRRPGHLGTKSWSRPTSFIRPSLHLLYGYPGQQMIDSALASAVRRACGRAGRPDALRALGAPRRRGNGRVSCGVERAAGRGALSSSPIRNELRRTLLSRPLSKPNSKLVSARGFMVDGFIVDGRAPLVSKRSRSTA